MLGLARLQQDRPASTILRECAQSMDKSRRQLLRPMVGVYLAEAEWRLGHHDASFAHAERALAVSNELRTLFPLQRALVDLPSVLDRQLGRHELSDEWRFGLTGHAPAEDRGQPRITSLDTTQVRVHTLAADQGIAVGGAGVGLRRMKAVELVAALCVRGPSPKDDLCKLIMPDSDRVHASNHYRQLLHVLRNEGIPIVRSPDGVVSFAPDIDVVSDDNLLEQQLREASAAVGADRLTRLLAALDLAKQEYLAGSELEWVELRRTELHLLVNEARADAARCAVDLRQHTIAADLCERVLEEDPFAEEVYRVLMRNEAARGSVDGASRVYRRMQNALEAIGVEPDAVSQHLLGSIRQS
jgi:DNA-binding SARP family transcriptional activator